MKTLSFVTATACALLILPPPLLAEGNEGYQVSGGADWRPYGIHSAKSGFGYNIEAAKIIHAGNRTEVTAGARAAYFPNERAYRWTNGSLILERARENRIFYAGIPLTLRYYFSSGRFAPFGEIKNLLDIRVLQQTKAGDTATSCFGSSPETCLEAEDFREASENSLLVWRQTLALGLRMRLRTTSLLLREGVQWDATPNREAVFLGPPVRGLYLSTNLGISF